MSGTRWLHDDQQRAWRAYLRMLSRLSAELNRELQAGSGLSLADYDVLVHLTDAPGGRLRPFALQRQLDWEQSRLSHHLSRMQRRGLIRREECGDDGRGAYVRLTAAGRQAIAAAAPGHVATVRRLLFDALEPEDVDTLRRIATRVLDRLDPTVGAAGADEDSAVAGDGGSGDSAGAGDGGSGNSDGGGNGAGSRGPRQGARVAAAAARAAGRAS